MRFLMCLSFALSLLLSQQPPQAHAHGPGTRPEPLNPLEIRFAFLGDESVLHSQVFLQGKEELRAAYRHACGPDGSRCACELFDSAGRKIAESGPGGFDYEETGNYFRCRSAAPLSQAAMVRLRKRHSRQAGPLSALKTISTLTLSDLLGHETNRSRIRSIFRYSCLETFLQKAGTTTSQFDCSDQATACNGDNFCLLQLRRSFHLFADSFGSNFNQKDADHLYLESGGGRICGLQIMRSSCTDAWGAPIAQFGLAGESTRFWGTAIQLAPAANMPPETYGFAAAVSPRTGECPPGLVKRVFFRVNPVSNAAAHDSNFPDGMVAYELAAPAAPPANLSINQISGGHCNGITCTLPNLGVTTISSQAYSSAGETAFCVIPASLLPLQKELPGATTPW